MNDSNKAKVLYEFNSMNGVYFFEECSSSDRQVLSHKLEYFSSFNGINDVIRYTRCNNKEIVSYYTIRNGIALCGAIKNGEIDWKYVPGMTNFVVARFKAFKDCGIIFINDKINMLLRRKHMRIKNR